MAISAPSYLTEAVATTGVTSLASPSFTPSANALVFVFISGLKGAEPYGTSYTIADGFGAGMGSWTQLLGAEVQFTDTSFFGSVTGWYAQAGASPGSATVTPSWTNATTRTAMHVIEIASGFNTSTPVPAASEASNTTTGTTLAVTLGQSLGAGSMAIGFVGSISDSDGITPGTDFTELRETDSGGAGGTCTLESQYDAGPADTTVDWSALAGNASGGIAFEVQEPGSDTVAGGVDRGLIDEPAGLVNNGIIRRSMEKINGIYRPDRRLIVPVGLNLQGA